MVSVKRARLSAVLSFQDIIAQGRPVVLEGLDIGPCTSKWSLDYLANQIGPDRKVGLVPHTDRQENLLTTRAGGRARLPCAKHGFQHQELSLYHHDDS